MAVRGARAGGDRRRAGGVVGGATPRRSSRGPTCRPSRRVSTCSPASPWFRGGFAATTTAGRRSARPGPTTTPRPAGTTAATPATTSSTATWSTRPTCRSSGAPTRWPPARCTTRTPTQTIAFVRGAQVGAAVQIDHIVPLALRVGPGCPGLDRRDADAVRQRSGQPAGGGRAGQPGQGRSASRPTWMPPNHAFWCQYAMQFIAVLRGYGLPVDEPSAAELRDAACELSGGARCRCRSPGSGRNRVPSSRPLSAVHLLGGQLEVEHVDVLGDALRVRRAGDHHVAQLQAPADQHLRRRLAVGAGDRRDRRVLQQLAHAERAVGLGDDRVLGVDGAQLGLVQQRVQLDLVDRRGEERQVDDVRQVLRR